MTERDDVSDGGFRIDILKEMGPAGEMHGRSDACFNGTHLAI